jgi:hypothetical protein
MALIIKDRVKETTTTTGTGTVTLVGASTGFRSFADIGNANTTYYCISGGSQFEVGIGTYTASGTTLSRDTVLSNSLGTTALINFSAGTKDVFVTYPSDKAILGTTSAVASTGTGSVVLSNAPSLTGEVTIGNATDTATITLGKSEDSQTVNIATGIVFDTKTKTINIGTNGDSGSLTNITIGSIGGASTTTFNGSNTLSGTLSGSFSGNVNATFLSASSTINLGGETGSTAQNLATNQTAGTFNFLTGQTSAILNIGGTTSATGAINIGRSTGNQAINIQNGAASTGATNIGSTTSTGTITIGRSTAAQTVNIATGTTAASTTKTINIGNAGNATSTTNIAIGSATGTSTTTVNGVLKQQTYLVANLPAGFAGARAFVSDASGVVTALFGTTVVGGGSNGVPVYHDGTSWKVG